jgi:hypothetical protein
MGALAGWLTLAGILAFEVIGPSLAIGQRVTGSTDRGQIEAYYANSVLVWFGIGQVAIIIGFVVFVTALREALVRREQTSFWANTGFAFALVAAALLLVRSAVEMSLVRALAAGTDILPSFFVWDFTYNGALYAMEAGYPTAFALAMTGWRSTPRWYLGLALVVSALQLVNMTSLAVGLPLAATLPGNIAFAAWFGVTAWILGRHGATAESAVGSAVRGTA